MMTHTHIHTHEIHHTTPHHKHLRHNHTFALPPSVSWPKPTCDEPIGEMAKLPSDAYLMLMVTLMGV